MNGSPSVRVALFIRESGSESPCRWFYVTGIYNLYEEREKYGANSVVPGLTGWAQINGRDELEIDVKAKLDGEYVRKMSFLFDCRCFFGTIFSVLRSDGVVEGGTGEMKKKEKEEKK